MTRFWTCINPHNTIWLCNPFVEPKQLWENPTCEGRLIWRTCVDVKQMQFNPIQSSWHSGGWSVRDGIITLTHRGRDKMDATLTDRLFQVQFRQWTVLLIPIKISLNFVRKGPMAWHQTGHELLHEPMMVQFNGVFMRHPGPLLLTWFNFNTSVDK